MTDEGRWSPDRVLLVIVLVVAVTVPVAATQLEIGPRRMTVGTAVVATALFAGSIALPALLLSRWQTGDRRSGREP